MEDDAPRAAPKAGRRAGRQVNNWGDESAAPPEPQKGGFGLDSAFGLGTSPSPPQAPMPGFGEDSSPSRGAGGGSGGGAPPSTGGGDEERTTPASRRRTRDMPDRAESGAQAASKALNLDLLSGDDSKKFIGVSRRKQEQLARGDDESSKKQIKYEAMTTGADGIMDIPELEEEGREDLSNVVAEAPKVRTNKVQGMEELEEEAHYKLPAMDDRDIDLSLLTAVLCSSEQVQEADEPWDPDIVLTEVASAIYTEREKAEGGDAPTEPDEPLNEMK